MCAVLCFYGGSVTHLWVLGGISPGISSPPPTTVDDPRYKFEGGGVVWRPQSFHCAATSDTPLSLFDAQVWPSQIFHYKHTLSWRWYRIAPDIQITLLSIREPRLTHNKTMMCAPPSQIPLCCNTLLVIDPVKAQTLIRPPPSSIDSSISLVGVRTKFSIPIRVDVASGGNSPLEKNMLLKKKKKSKWQIIRAAEYRAPPKRRYFKP